MAGSSEDPVVGTDGALVTEDVVQFDGENATAVLDWMGDVSADYAADGLHIFTSDGSMVAMPGDWVVREAPGRFRVRKPDQPAAGDEGLPTDHDEWVRDRVQAALDDPRGGEPHGLAMKRTRSSIEEAS